MKKTMIVKTALAMLLLLVCGGTVVAQNQKKGQKTPQVVKVEISDKVKEAVKDKFITPDGKIVEKKEKSSAGKELLKAKSEVFDDKGNVNTTKVYDAVEKMPEFAPCTYDITNYVRKDDQFVRETKTINNPGGQNGLMMFLNHNVKYPSIAEENGIQGRVVCKFVVERDGSITEVTVARSVDPVLDKEAVRVLKSMPKWIPGMQDGKPVRVQYTVPVTFKLQ